MFTLEIRTRDRDGWDSQDLEGAYETADDAYQAFEREYTESFHSYVGSHSLVLNHNNKEIFKAFKFAGDSTYNKGELLTALAKTGKLSNAAQAMTQFMRGI